MATSNGSRANPKELPKECFNRRLLVAAHEKRRHAAEQELQRNGKQTSDNPIVGGSADSGKSLPLNSVSSQPLSSLKEIFLPQLEIDKRHHGQALFGTLSVRPFKIPSSIIMSILADKSGKAVSLSILNLPFSLSGEEIEARFPSGRKAAIKEPYLRVCDDGTVLLRVENPTDVVLVDDASKEILRLDSDPYEGILEGVLKELDDLRAKGNKLFGEHKWKEAIAKYKKCILRGSAILDEGKDEKVNQRLLLAYSNRSEVWLQMTDYKNALDDANKALEFDPNHSKSLSRRDRAWQGVGKVQPPAGKMKAPVDEVNAADKGLDSKIKAKDVTQPAPTASKGKTTTKPTPPSSGVSTGNGKYLKPVSALPTLESASVDSASKGKTTTKPTPPSSGVSTGNGKYLKPVSALPTLESASVDSKKKPGASSVTATKSMDTESKNLVTGGDASAASTPKVKATTQRKCLSPPPPNASKVQHFLDTESKIPVIVGDTSATATSKAKASIERKSESPPPLKASKMKHIVDTESKNLIGVDTSTTSVSKVKATTERKNASPPPPKASKVKHIVDTESKNVADVDTSTTSASKVKATRERKTASPPPPKASKVKHIVDTESKKLVVRANTSATSTSKVKASIERKSASPPPPKASKVKHIDTNDNPFAASVTPTKGKKRSLANIDQPSASAGHGSSKLDQSRADSDPPSAARGKVATFSNVDKTVAAADDTRSKCSDSDSENNSPSSDRSALEECSFADDGTQNCSLIEPKPRKANGPSGDSSLPPRVLDSRLTLRSSPEPHKEMATGTSDAAIDIELPPFAAWLDSIRSSADVILSQGNWSNAVMLYNRVTGFALPQRNRDKVIQTLFLAYSHRSEAWIWTGDFETSLRDADSAIKIVDNYPKSVVGYEGKHLLNEVRRGRAFHGLGEYEKACLVFHEALKKYPNDKSIDDLLSKSRVALGQSQKGIYDLEGWFVNRCRGPPPPCSDFVGPVEIRRVLGKGRGLFVTKDVEAGDLLLVSNPLLVVRGKLSTEDDEDYRHPTTKWRRSRPGADPVGLLDFVNRLVRLRTDKEIYQLYSLTGGNPEDEIEVPDMSIFSPGAQHVNPQGFEILKISDQEPRRLERISRIAIRNTIEGGLNPLDGNNDNKDEAIRVGIWALPSFMNHSCVPNCHMIDIGDAMFLRASRDIEKGEELTRAYFDVFQNGIDRCKLCAEWSFVCNCERCILEKSLTDQRILPSHEYPALLERAREEAQKRQQFAGREKSLSVLLPNPQPALLQLRKFADWCDGLLDQAEGLGNKEKAWIGASHLEAYISRSQGSKDRNQFILSLENILEFMTNTAILAIGRTAGSALEKAAMLLAQVEDMYGRGSQTYRRIEARVLDLYQTTFGVLSEEVLYAMSRLMISR